MCVRDHVRLSGLIYECRFIKAPWPFAGVLVFRLRNDQLPSQGSGHRERRNQLLVASINLFISQHFIKLPPLFGFCTKSQLICVCLRCLSLDHIQVASPTSLLAQCSRKRILYSFLLPNTADILCASQHRYRVTHQYQSASPYSLRDLARRLYRSVYWTAVNYGMRCSDTRVRNLKRLLIGWRLAHLNGPATTLQRANSLAAYQRSKKSSLGCKLIDRSPWTV